MRLRQFFLFPLAISISGWAGAQSAGHASLLVLSKQDHTMAIVDPATFKIAVRLPVGDDPHEIVASSDGSTAYVSNYGFGRFNTITALDLVEQKPMKTIGLGALRGPHGLHFVDGKVWFTAEAAKCIGRYDPVSGQVDWIMGMGQNRTHMLYVFPGGERIVTTNVNSGTVTILNHVEAKGGPAGSAMPPPPGLPQGGILPSGGDWILTNVGVGTRDEGFDVSPDGKQMWVANSGDGTVSVVDIEAKKLIATMNADVKSANRLKFTPDGKRVLISMLGSGDLVVIDVAGQKVEKRIAVGHGAAGILVQPDGARAYVACTPDNYVAVIDLKTLEAVGHIEAGGNPDGLAWAVRR